MNEKIIEKIIKGKGTILIYIDESGEVMMLTTGELSKDQVVVLSKIITVVDNHSLVLKLVLGLEMLFDSLVNRVTRFFKG